MSIRKILLATSAALVLAAGGFLAARGVLTAPAGATSSPSALQPVPPLGPLTATPYRYGSAGPVTIFRRGAEPRRFVILISDKAGWTPALTDLARQLTSADATVVGVDLRRYLNVAQDEAGPHGLYPAGDFSELAQAAQRALKFTTYHRPILVGQGAGAALAYGTLAQSPAGIFQGGAALDFQADLKTGRPLLAGDGGLAHAVAPNDGFAYAADSKLGVPFVILQAGDMATAQAFAAKLPQGRVTTLATGAPVAASLSRALEMIAPVAASAPPAPAARLADLPLVEAPVVSRGDTLAVFYSGDGGWAGIDQGLAKGFVKAGVPVVGYDSLRYFWTKRSPQAAADDLAAVIHHYQAAWGKQRVILAGYSFGADALPIIVQHLPADLRGQVRIVALLGADATGELEFHPGDWLDVSDKDTYPIAPVLASLKDVPMVCVYGSEEHDDACPTFPAVVRKVGLPGDHHFNGDYDAVGRVLNQAAGL
ncbi:AcvB/VirJ family lysyl-phosphatidylglycerol hydrolase [Caulobacter sp. UNC279MFTsu5.1]|uniref:AcvB/VirJ family lysyl-phosphatidylglycerol hydrolase n=1 Tax=Caulobacter sp. UNC279MFTsu5.1 TaxID=1502775 RepID=UPI0008EF0F5F|nr:AcvB/VirJ family lysyl-phosphatidylglycerol hydrolase [Caulobacter sp. UNC279MFTsu5.1]SFK57544.1 Type IV secretory pathway, VirJ component [Caulobacter sp. UNC279MFTsu5.1]